MADKNQHYPDILIPMTMPDYYCKYYAQYHEKTFRIDPAAFLSVFAGMLHPGAHVLDVGCGSGRDLLWLTKQGFRATGLDASPGLAALARRYSNCPVIEADFESFDFSTVRADALLLSGSLVHLPHDRMETVLINILQAVAAQEKAMVYLSLKEGKEPFTDKRNRTFHPWQDSDARYVFRGISLRVVDFARTPSMLGTGEAWLGYVLERKPNATTICQSNGN